MKYLLLILCFGFTFASTPLQIPLEKIIENTDHVLTGYVTGVDMIDDEGNQITDLSARTGPGIKKKIRLIVKVQEVLITNEEIVPDELAIPLDGAMHFSFGQVKDAHSNDNGTVFLILLKGKAFQPPFSGVFRRNISEKNKVLELINAKDSNSISEESIKSILLGDKEIESYMIGKWYISPNDSSYEYGNAISTYTKDHILSFVGYSDKGCNTINLQAVGTWEILNKKLVITVEQSTPLGVFKYGEKVIDRVLSINSKDKVLMSVNDTDKQYRTKSNTCIGQ